MPQVIRVVAVDPHPVFLEGLARSLRVYDDLEIVGLTTSADEFVSFVRQQKPDVALIDALMSGGIEAARSATRAHRAMKIIMLAGSVESIPEAAVKISGGHAWVLKTMGAAYLASTIRVTQSGGFTIGPGLSGRIVLTGGQLIDRTVSREKPVRFTSRENDVMRCVCQGLTNREAANTLGIREATVRNYVVKVKRKLHAASRSDIARLGSSCVGPRICSLFTAISALQYLGYACEVL